MVSRPQKASSNQTKTRTDVDEVIGDGSLTHLENELSVVGQKGSSYVVPARSGHVPG
jgi:hypothetical protein